jgi:hypothetical protein
MVMMHGKPHARLRALVLASAAVLAMGQMAAAQTSDPGSALDEVTGQAGQAVGEPSAPGGTSGTEAGETEAREAVAPSVPAQPTEDDDIGGHETENPQEPDHASGAVADVDLVGEDLVEVGSTRSEIRDDGSSSGDVTVLAIGGEEIVGAHSDSRNGPEEDEVAPFDALCEDSGGDVCLGLLFAHTSSHEGQQSSSARSQAALAFACLGGNQTAGSEDCEGPVGAGVSTSRSRIDRDHGSGRTTATQETRLADACIGPEGETVTGCSGVGVELMRSSSRSDSGDGTGPGATRRNSSLADVEAGGQTIFSIRDPEALELPPGCPTGQSLVCLYLNQGESFVFVGGGASRQEVLHISALPGLVDGADLALGHLASAETLARNVPGGSRGGSFGPPDGGPAGPPGPLGEEVGPGPAEPTSGEGLAFTGVNALGLVAAMLLLAVAGAALVLWDRRRSAAG